MLDFWLTFQNSQNESREILYHNFIPISKASSLLVLFRKIVLDAV